MNENISVKEVRAKVAEYFEDARAIVSVHTFGMRIEVEIKYWDFKPERNVRHDIEAISDNIDIKELDRVITEESLYKSVMDLIDKETKVYYQDGETLRMTHLHDIIYTNALCMDFGGNGEQ